VSTAKARLTAWTTGIIAAIALATCLVYLSSPGPDSPAPSAEPQKPSSTPADAAPAPATPTAKPKVAARNLNGPERSAIQPLPPAPKTDPDDRSPLADKLNARDQAPAQDLAIVFNLFQHYRERFGSFPAGEDNRAFVNALTGNNPRKLAFLDRNNPAINPRGELTDRWGTPFFFHQQSRDEIEIRSAGPDLEMYTADDLRHGSPAAAPSGP